MDFILSISESKSQLGEGIYYDFSNDTIYWVDIDGECIYSKNLISQVEDKLDIGEKVSCIRPTTDERWIVAQKSGIYLYDFNSLKKELVAKIETRDDFRYNDGTCDVKGRFLIGTYGMEGQEKESALYSIEKGKCKVLLNEVTNSNGICFSSDDNYMYYIDTGEEAVFRFSYDAEKGTVKDRKMWIDFSNEEGFPDGMAIDQKGNLYIAHFGGAKVSVWQSEKREKIHEYCFPVANVTCPVIGKGSNPTLYVTSAQKEEESESGRVFAAKALSSGIEQYKYKV